MKTKIYNELSELYPLWRKTLLQKDAIKEEAQFVVDLCNTHPQPIRSIIDLGGSVGSHANLLQQHGYDVTVFDQSEEALAIAQKQYPNIHTIQGSFETIAVTQKYDAAVCLWSTLSYIHNEQGRKHFYNWMRKHIRHVIILDQANFWRYEPTFHKVYEGENDQYTLTVTRDWVLNNKHRKDTTLSYKITNKRTHVSQRIQDFESEQYLTIEELEKYLGSYWNLRYLCGDYVLSDNYVRSTSQRMIVGFFRTEN